MRPLWTQASWSPRRRSRHYEIARYGTLKTWAGELGLNEAVKLLEMTLAEEKKTDEALSKLALSEVNQHAQAA